MIREEFNSWINFEQKNNVDSNHILSHTLLILSENNTKNKLNLVFWMVSCDLSDEK